MTESASILYLSGCSCCLSGSLTGCVRLGGGPGTTGWVNHVRTGQHLELSPCSSFPSPHDGSRGREAAGPSGCPSSYWNCGSLSSYTDEKVRGKVDVKNTLLEKHLNPSRALTHLFICDIAVICIHHESICLTDVRCNKEDYKTVM